MHRPAFPSVLPADVRLDALSTPFGSTRNDAPEPVIPFEPVPRRRNRRSGWTPERQRAFIAALACCGCVSVAARYVGLNPRTAYRLLDMEGADSFAAAWDQAQDIGRARLQADALERAMNGSFVPVYRRGRLVRVEYRRSDRLAISMLNGKDHQSLANSGAVSRRNHRMDLAAVDAARNEVERQRVEQRAQYETELQEMIRRGEELLRTQRQPRIRSL